MENWNYFRIVTLAWGVVAIVTKPVFFKLAGERWRTWLLGSAYTEGRRPGWIHPVAVLLVLLIAYTWFRVWIDDVPYDWVLALLMTVSAVKLAALLLHYEKFQTWVKDVLKDSQKENRMVAQVTVAGALLVLLAFFLY